MKLQEAMAMTISRGDLRHSVLEETGADRMGALGRSDPLGAALWRVTDDLDARALIRAGILLARRVLKGRDDPELILRLSQTVLREWLANRCRKCHGRGFIYANGMVHDVCKVCRGEGVRRHSDSERVRAMQFTDRRMYGKWERRFADAHAALADANFKVRRQAARQLERGRGR
jgi:hypothetical protein